MAGYDSYREALLEQEILEYSPDLIIMLTGHNEGLASPPLPIWILKAKERFERFAAYRALERKLKDEPSLSAETTPAGRRRRDASFDKNLRANLAHARERK